MTLLLGVLVSLIGCVIWALWRVENDGSYTLGIPGVFFVRLSLPPGRPVPIFARCRCGHRGARHAPGSTGPCAGLCDLCDCAEFKAPPC